MSRLSPHVITASFDALRWASRASAVKQVGGTSAFATAPAGALRVYRKYFPVQDIMRHGGEVAREVLAEAGDADVVLLFNETAQDGLRLQRHTQLLREAAPVVHAAGKLLGGYCFSTSFPLERDIPYLVENDWGDCDVLVMHEYWGLKDVPLDERFTRWNALKHRVVHELSGGRHPPILIGECGRDLVRDGPADVNNGLVGAGYQVDGISEEQMIEEYLYYESLLLEDIYVVAAFAFTDGPTQDWREKGFDVDPLALELAHALPFTPQKQYLESLLTLSTVSQPPLGGQMAIVDPAARFPGDYDEWKASGGVPNIDFLGWMAVVKGYKLSAEEYRAIANSVKGNAEALLLLPEPPK